MEEEDKVCSKCRWWNIPDTISMQDPQIHACDLRTGAWTGPDFSCPKFESRVHPDARDKKIAILRKTLITSHQVISTLLQYVPMSAEMRLMGKNEIDDIQNSLDDTR